MPCSRVQFRGFAFQGKGSADLEPCEEKERALLPSDPGSVYGSKFRLVATLWLGLGLLELCDNVL